MSEVKEKIIKNVKWLSLTVFFIKLIKLCIILWIAKELLPEKYGVFVYFLSLINLCYIMSDLGIRAVFQKEFFSKKSRSVMSTIVLTRVGLSSFGLIVSGILPLLS